MFLQLIFGLVVLRTRWGYNAFDWLGDRVTEYLEHTNAGAKFVFGENFMDHFFAFQVMCEIDKPPKSQIYWPKKEMSP